MSLRTVNEESVNDTAKLVIHRIIARDLLRDPIVLVRARLNLETIAERYPERSFVGEWREVLEGTPSEVAKALVSRDERMARLRLSSPFAVKGGYSVDFTDPGVRRRIWRLARRVATLSANKGAEAKETPEGMVA